MQALWFVDEIWWWVDGGWESMGNTQCMWYEWFLPQNFNLVRFIPRELIEMLIFPPGRSHLHSLPPSVTRRDPRTLCAPCSRWAKVSPAYWGKSSLTKCRKVHQHGFKMIQIPQQVELSTFFLFPTRSLDSFRVMNRGVVGKVLGFSSATRRWT